MIQPRLAWELARKDLLLFAADRRGALLCFAVPVVLATRAAPEFWIGMVLLALLSFKLGWFPSGGASSPGVAASH